MDHRAVGDGDAGADHHERLDRDVVAERRIGGEIHRLRRDQRHAGIECGLAQPRLHHRLRLRKLRLGVDAAHFVLAGFDHDGLQSHFPDDGDGIDQIILAFAVGVSDPVEDLQRAAAVERHHAGIAQRHLALLWRRVGMFADRHQAIAFEQQPAVAGGVGGAEAEHREGCALFQRRAQPRKGRGRNQRRIAERHQQIVRAARNRLARRQHGMRRAEPLGLNESGRIRPYPFDLVRDGLVVRSDHDREGGISAVRSRFQHMRQQRLAGDGVQNLRQRGAHARALAGRKHDSQAGSSGHSGPWV